MAIQQKLTQHCKSTKLELKKKKKDLSWEHPLKEFRFANDFLECKGNTPGPGGQSESKGNTTSVCTLFTQPKTEWGFWATVDS